MISNPAMIGKKFLFVLSLFLNIAIMLIKYTVCPTAAMAKGHSLTIPHKIYLHFYPLYRWERDYG